MDRYTKPEFQSAALITIDTQRDTLDGQPLEIPGTSAALPNMARLLKDFRDARRPIIHVVRIYIPDGSNADICRKSAIEGGRAMLLENSIGSQLAEAILPAQIKLDSKQLLSGAIQSISEHEVIIYKPRWGAFFGTALHSYLQTLHISTLIFSGCNFPNCPRTSIYEASERDYRVVLISDAISGLYEQGVKEMQNIGISLFTTEDLLANISNANQAG